MTARNDSAVTPRLRPNRHNRLRELRRRRGLTLLQMSALVGIDISSLSAIESGLRVPLVTTALRLASVYGETVESIWREAVAWARL